MGYQHITNLYKNKSVLMFKEVYALEKVHGTSAHISYRQNQLFFSPGGEKLVNFTKLFDQDELFEKFKLLGHNHVVVFGELYGGSQQKMSATYGKDLNFIAFEVKIDDAWLNVKNAFSVSEKLGIEFVPFELVECTIENLNFERDRPSRVAKRRGILEDKPSEGIVIRPLEEVYFSNGDRVVAKHKTELFSERTSKSDTIINDEKLTLMTEAKEIALEWVTPMRLNHVLDKLPKDIQMKDVREVILAMQEDVTREAAGEIVINKNVLSEIGKLTVELFKKLRLDKKVN